MDSKSHNGFPTGDAIYLTIFIVLLHFYFYCLLCIIKYFFAFINQLMDFTASVRRICKKWLGIWRQGLSYKY